MENRIAALEGVVSTLVKEIGGLKDALSLKVSKGDLISEVNIEAGRVLIDGDGLVVTEGTLHTSKVNTINLISNNILEEEK